jgi:hypothetical protein
MANAKKQRKAPVEDIDHEHIPQQAAQAAPVVEEAVVIDDAKNLELTIQREIKRFNLADAGITALKDKYSALIIQGADDKEGYKLVKQAWQEVRTTRTSLEKKGLAIRGDFTAITKAVKKEEDRLVGLISPLEDDLYNKWKKIDDEKEAEKQRLAAIEQQRLDDRLKELMDSGVTFSNGYYGIGETIAIDVATLRSMSDDQYVTLLAAVKSKAEQIRMAKEVEAEKQRLADQERERENARLKQQADDLEKEKNRIAREQEDLARQQQEAEKARRELRLDMLQFIGMTISAGGQTVAYDNGAASYTMEMDAIMAMTDVEFKQAAQVARDKITLAKQKLQEREDELLRERQALDELKTKIGDLMAGAGLSYNYAKEVFYFKNDFADINQPMNELLCKDWPEIVGLCADLRDRTTAAIDQQNEKQQQDDRAKETDRRQKLGDAANFEEYVYRVLKVELPEMQSDPYKEKLRSFFLQLNRLAKKYLPKKEVVA